MTQQIAKKLLYNIKMFLEFVDVYKESKIVNTGFYHCFTP